MNLLKWGCRWAEIQDETDSCKIWEYIYGIRKWLDKHPLFAKCLIYGTKDMTKKQLIDLREHYPTLSKYLQQ